MIKRFLKWIVPITVLKKIFLLYNKFKIDTIDRILFPKLLISPSDFTIYHTKNPFTELQIRTEGFSDKVQNGFKIWNNPDWTQDEFLLQYNHPGYLEPHVGWGMSINRKLIFPSLGFANAPYVRKPSLLETYICKREIVYLESIVSMRDTGEENYFHFFNDVLAKIFFLSEKGVALAEYTFVVSSKLYSKEYFQYYLQNSFLKSLKWHVQKEEWIYYRKAIFCKPYTHTSDFLKQAAQLSPDIAVAGSQNRKIFLTRDRKTLRFIINEDEVKQLVRKYDYEIIDTAALSFLEQVQIFRETRYLIAIHGAGISNIIFRMNQPLHLLEIAPFSEYIPFHYIMLASVLQYSYQVMQGSAQDIEGGFLVDLEELEMHIKRSEQ